MGKLLSIIYFLICFTGFLCHLNKVFVEYFKYQTGSKIAYEFDMITAMDRLKVPAIVTCFTYLDILTKKVDNTNLTLKDIFYLTPAVDHVLKRIDCRHPTLIYLDPLCSTNTIHIGKYFMAEYMCYNFFFNSSVLPFSSTVIANSGSDSSLIYRLTLQSVFNTASNVYTFLHYPTSIRDTPFTSRKYGIKFHKRDRHILRNNWYQLYPNLQQAHLLESPYDTHCERKGSANRCRKNCLIDRINSSFNRLPVTEIFDEGIDIKLLIIMRNITANDAKIILNIYDFCLKKCLRPSCDCTISMTRGQDFLNVTSGDNNVFEVMVPNSINIIMTTYAIYSFQDMLIYVSSCVGIWFGISVWSLNQTWIYMLE